MNAKAPKPTEVYRIIDRKTGKAQESRATVRCTEVDFESVNDARLANCHGIFEDKSKYKIAKYRITYELIEDDCDNAESVPLHQEEPIHPLSKMIWDKMIIDLQNRKSW